MSHIQDQGRLILLVGPSGSGKNTMLGELYVRREFCKPVSCTTRSPKAGEVHGQDYHFLTHEWFTAKVERGEFAEWAIVHGNFYGTLAADLQRLVDSGKDIIFDIDIQGAKQLKMKFPEAKIIFITPPSVEEILRRINSRNRGDTPDEIATRLTTAKAEMEQMGIAD